MIISFINNSGDVDFRYISSNDLYDRVIPLIIIPEFRTSILTGLVVSVGGITESLVSYCIYMLLKNKNKFIILYNI